MGLTTRHSEFLQQQLNWTTADGVGISVTPGVSNAKGSWVDVFGGTVTDDTFGIWLAFHDSPGAHNDILADVGIDTSGGTSYSVLIPNLICGYASSFLVNTTHPWGHSYYFPLFIPAGSRLACRMQTVLGTAIACKLRSRLMQKPTHPELLKVGDFVDAVGVNTSLSRGTAITAGPRVDGTYASLGTAPRDAFYFESGCGMSNSATLTNSNQFVDFAVGNPQRVLIDHAKLGAASDNTNSYEFVPSRWRYVTLPAGVTLYSRAKSDDSTPDQFHAAMYLVGGLGRS